MQMKENPGPLKTGRSSTRCRERCFCGMAIAARAVGAKKGYVYLRGEYKFLIPKLNEYLDTFHKMMDEFNHNFQDS